MQKRLKIERINIRNNQQLLRDKDIVQLQAGLRIV